jgi:two-component system, LytTR family, response regulator
MKILIVDDEVHARRGLRQELAKISGMTCVGECCGVDDTVKAIVEKHPDLVLLDVQLGQSTAFEVIEEVGIDAMPLVIFVTAYDRHALRAFEVHAVDYLLKPVDPQRLRESLDHAAHLGSLERDASLGDRLEQLVASQRSWRPGGERPNVSGSGNRLVVRDGPRLAFVDVAAVDWIEANGNFVVVHVGERAYPVRTTMARMQERLAQARDITGASLKFLRIRRSALINERSIVTLEPYSKSTFVVRLRSGVKLISSRYHLASLRELLK